MGEAATEFVIKGDISLSYLIGLMIRGVIIMATQLPCRLLAMEHEYVAAAKGKRQWSGPAQFCDGTNALAKLDRLAAPFFHDTLARVGVKKIIVELSRVT